jgi:hypothetical protein
MDRSTLPLFSSQIPLLSLRGNSLLFATDHAVPVQHGLIRLESTLLQPKGEQPPMPVRSLLGRVASKIMLWIMLKVGIVAVNNRQKGLWGVWPALESGLLAPNAVRSYVSGVPLPSGPTS